MQEWRHATFAIVEGVATVVGLILGGCFRREQGGSGCGFAAFMPRLIAPVAELCGAHPPLVFWLPSLLGEGMGERAGG
jgi:hypothetical protein